MISEDAKRFPPFQKKLRDNRTVTVRLLETTDGSALGDFYESIPREDFRFYGPHPLTHEKALEKAGNANDPCFVCVVIESQSGSIGGYAWYKWANPDSEKSGMGICVSRDFQGTGTGRVLLERLLEIAKSVGPPIMYLTVQHANSKAVEFYQKMGFKVVREQTRKASSGFPEEPEYYMELRVHN